MTPSEPASGSRASRRDRDITRDPPEINEKSFIVLAIAVSVAFAAILFPFLEAIFWAIVLAVLFMPLRRRFSRRLGGKETLAALLTLGIILLIVILPLVMVGSALVAEVADLASRLKGGQIDFGGHLERLVKALPPWVAEQVHRFGLDDFAALRSRFSAGALGAVQSAGTHVLSIGQNTFAFLLQLALMLYLLFFMLRDGPHMQRRIRAALPLRRELHQGLFEKFATVIRATIKGNIAVALAQGALGGLIFWFLGVEAPVLWGVLMAILSLLPAIGAGLVWGPVAAYFLLTGSFWQGILLAAYGVLVIGLVDNILRPILVGKDTRLPDYVVLVSTLGGIAVFGLAGFVLGPVIAALFIAVWEVVAAYRTLQGENHG